ncbi:MAG: YggS family pyridoxal phosphate-dependent enzyme [Flavobacteriaceae bacterium]
MSIQDNLNTIKQTIPDTVTLVAVSKTKPIELLQEAYDAGQRIFGENKIQELTEKHKQLPKDIEWHMIGHVQRNKVKYIAPFVSLIHAVDNLKLLVEINKQAKKHNRIINCLLQLKIATEDNKFGLSQTELQHLLHSEDIKTLEHIHISGLMGMATFTDNQEQIETEFNELKTTFDSLKNYTTPNCKFETLSMGMSGDYQLAINCGSNMVRIGSSIFGVRTYNK